MHDETEKGRKNNSTLWGDLEVVTQQSQQWLLDSVFTAPSSRRTKFTWSCTGCFFNAVL